MCCLHSAAWWRRHWERTGILDIDLADTLPDGWQLWRDWQTVVAPDNAAEIQALEADRGSYLGYVRLVGRRRADARLDEPIVSIPECVYEEALAPQLRVVCTDEGTFERPNTRVEPTPRRSETVRVSSCERSVERARRG